MQSKLLKYNEEIEEGDFFYGIDGATKEKPRKVINHLYFGNKVSRYLKRFPSLRIIRPTKGGEKMTKKKYPNEIYTQFNCPDNDDLAMKASHDPTHEYFVREDVIAVYELKELVKVEMRPHIKKVK